MDISELTVKEKYRKLSNDDLVDLHQQGDLDDRFVPILNEVLSERGLSERDLKTEISNKTKKDHLLACRTVEEISSQYEAKDIAFKRAAATVIDYVVIVFIIFSVFLTCDLLHIGNGSSFPLIISIVLYILIGEWVFGKTIGKCLLKLSIVNSDGGKPGFFQVLTRTAARIIELNPSVIGGLPALLFVINTRRRQRLGDIVAETYVVSDADLKLMKGVIPLTD